MWLAVEKDLHVMGCGWYRIFTPSLVCRKILSTWELLKDFIFSLQAQKPPVQDWIFTSEKKYIRMLPDHVSEADVDLLGLGLGW